MPERPVEFPAEESALGAIRDWEWLMWGLMHSSQSKTFTKHCWPRKTSNWMWVIDKSTCSSIICSRPKCSTSGKPLRMNLPLEGQSEVIICEMAKPFKIRVIDKVISILVPLPSRPCFPSNQPQPFWPCREVTLPWLNQFAMRQVMKSHFNFVGSDQVLPCYLQLTKS